jgi:type VI secretion system secreted protein Hcp
MASIFMKIGGLDDVKGAATVAGLDVKGLFAINNISWGAARGVTVDVGNANNADKGMVAMSDINISRESDGASPHLTTMLYAPGTDGKKIDIYLTKPARDGSGGADPFMVFTLEKARISNYNVSGSDGGLPSESFSLTYVVISLVYYTENEAGEIIKGDTVKYDVSTGKLESKAG